jgi:type II secretory pathway pseudopilin PulG
MSRQRRFRKRRGFTLMQLLVILALLLVMLGFLLAAVARVRSAAERTESQSKLRQLVIAIHSYAEVQDGRVPPGPAAWFPKKGLVASNGYGPCLFHLLPYIEQGPLYNSTLKKVGDTPIYASWEAAGKSVNLFMASNDPTLEKVSDRTSFLVNELALPETGGRLPASFPDGTSQTIFFAEGYSQASDTATFGGRAITWKTERRWWDNPGWKPVAGAVLFQVAPPLDAASSVLPQGFTPAGIIVGMGDGSSRVVSPRCSATTFYAACTPAGNDILGADW